MLHPDSQFEILRSLQEERLQEARLSRQLKAATETNGRLSILDCFLLATGEFLIAFGTRMKRRVYPQGCGQRSAAARHVLS
jgi:hypothetical protein